MATLSLEVGTLSSSLDATNVNAERILDGFLKYEIGSDAFTLETYEALSDQEKLDKVILLLKEHLVARAKEYERKSSMLEAKTLAEANEPIFE